MHYLKILPVLVLFFLSSFLVAEPTETRKWTSKVGTTINASALSLSGDRVTFLTDKRRKLTVKLSQLRAQDQQTLKDHFAASSASKSAPKAKPPSLDQPLGKMVGPIAADSDSNYFLYLPTTMVEGVEPPIVFWSGWNGGTLKRMDPFVKVAELTGVALAVSVESRNGTPFDVNSDHAKACLKHIGKNFPINVERAFFSGSSGGGATAFYNSGALKCAGAMPMVGYIPGGTTPNRKGFYYVVGGANDYNRYSSVRAVDQLGKRATYRMHTGGHHRPITPAMAFEGTLWLYTRHLYEKPGKYETELAHFEPRLMEWLKANSKTSPHTTYFWTDHLLETCDVQGDLRELAESLNETLSEVERNKGYLDAHRALEEFGLSILLKESAGGSIMNHTSPAIQEGVKKLKEKYSGLPEIDEILEELAKPTDNAG